jgi:hypothetical protein
MKRILRTVLTVLISHLICTVQAQTQHHLNLPLPIYDSSGKPLYNTPPIISQAAAGLSHWMGTDEISMVQIGTLVAPLCNTLAGGDSDEDGLFEVYMYIKDNAGGWSFTYRIYEDDGLNNYNQVAQVDDDLIPYTFADLDNDGLPEVIGQSGSYLHIFESPAPGELATNFVWQSPVVSNVVGYTAAGDLDQDGWGEIIHTDNTLGPSSGLVIYECVGDNQYQQIFSQPISVYCSGEKAIADFDGDGLMELAFPSAEGILHIFESTGNNSFVETFQGNMNTDNAYACCLADDMDGNGRPEIVCGGSSGNHGWRSLIFEADGDNSFVIRQAFDIQDGHFGYPGNVAGDFDGDGVDEFIIQTAELLHLFKWNGNTYASEGTIPESFGSTLHGIFCYDANNNGYDDVFWVGIGDGGYWENSTILLEFEYAGFTPDVSVTLNPYNPPIIVPESGGSFDFNVSIHNNEPAAHTASVWCDVTLPNGQSVGPLIGPVWTEIASGDSIARDRTQIVPEQAPSGIYDYNSYVGIYPSTIWDSDSFSFEKTGESVGITVGNWTNFGDRLRVDEASSNLQSSDFLLFEVYPNPFNPVTVISFQLSVISQVSLEIYDVGGRLIESPLHDSWRDKGVHEVTFNAGDLPSGVYLYKLHVSGSGTIPTTVSGKLLLVK